ncbi:MAG TPA: YhjD/YihY/BrkB family envelope integrity protein [Verrucomicrobiae bacterium]
MKEAAKSWSGHDASRLGAALAFYTIFAIAPLFIIVLAIAGMWFGEEAARKQLFDQLNALVGEKGGEAIQAVVAAADKPAAGVLASVAAVGTLFVGATGVFVELQSALNTVWNVKRETGRGVVHFIKDRLMSFAMILAIGFLLLVSLVVSAGLSALGSLMSGYLPAEEIIWKTINFLISLGVITVLFAMIFKVLPDIKISWRNVWGGALLTAFLFNLGKSLLSIYLGRGSFSSAYGAAGSLVIILVWVYYSAQILFFGAEFTRLADQESRIREAKANREKQPDSKGHAESKGKMVWVHRVRQWFNERFSEKARKVLVGIVGSVVILAGVMMIFFPGPAFVVIPAGFAIMAIEFEWARKYYDKARDGLRKAKEWVRSRTKKGKKIRSAAASHR